MPRSKKIRRSDLCYLVGLRASKLPPEERCLAWAAMALYLESLGEKEMPKFADLIHAIRTATIKAKNQPE